MTYDLRPEQAGWLTQRVGQGILLDEDGKVLLSGNRWYSNKPLVWTLPGGRAEEGEGLIETVVREFAEETGLSIEADDLAFVVEARSIERRRLFHTCAFTVRRISGDLTCAGDQGVEELKYVSPSEIPLYMPGPSIGNPLQYYFESRTTSARYWFFPEYMSE